MRTNALILVWPLALAALGAGVPADNQPQPTVHWAFVAPHRPAPLSLKRKEWALNPIDRFILARLEQAGVAPSPCADRVTLIRRLNRDLLPGATTAQQVATGFHRNTQINQEGGIDPEQFRVESVIDRVNTTATVFLGVTLGCAQCHDHKFDPFTQREYYQMFAFFNSSQHDGHGKGDFGPVLELPTAAEKKSLETHRQHVQQMESELKKYADELRGKAGEWEAGLDDAARQKLKTDVQAALAVQPEQRAAAQQDVVFAAFRDQG